MLASSITDNILCFHKTIRAWQYKFPQYFIEVFKLHFQESQGPKVVDNFLFSVDFYFRRELGVPSNNAYLIKYRVAK